MVIAWKNHQQTEQQMIVLKRGQDTLDARASQLAEVEQQIVERRSSIQRLQQQIENLETENVDLANQLVMTESELQLFETKHDDLSKQVETNGQVNFAAIKAQQLKNAKSHEEVESLEIKVTEFEGIVAVSEVENKRLQQTRSQLETLRHNQDRGVITGGLKSSLVATYQQWGFVVVDAGSLDGVVPFANLEAYRQGEVIGQLLVTQVESNRSIADIVPGSLPVGISLQAGDMIVQNLDNNNE